MKKNHLENNFSNIFQYLLISILDLTLGFLLYIFHLKCLDPKSDKNHFSIKWIILFTFLRSCLKSPQPHVCTLNWQIDENMAKLYFASYKPDYKTQLNPNFKYSSFPQMQSLRQEHTSKASHFPSFTPTAVCFCHTGLAEMVSLLQILVVSYHESCALTLCGAYCSHTLLCSQGTT